MQELARKLLDALEVRMQKAASTNSNNNNIIRSMFEGTIKTSIKCIKVPVISSVDESFLDLQLTVLNHRDVYESLRTYTHQELLDGENKYNAEGYGLQEAYRGMKFASLPPVLMLHLKRFEFDTYSNTQHKIHQNFIFPDLLNMQSFVEGENDCVYTLHA